MYRDFKKEDWMRKFQINEDEIPDGLLLYGIMDVNKGREMFERHTDIRPELWLMHNVYRFIFKKKKIALAITYGSSMTSEFVHIFSVLGTNIVLQIGSFGGLRLEMQVGDILIPTKGVRMDGASDWYLEKDATAEPTSAVLDWMHTECHQKWMRRHRLGPILTTTAMLAETPSIIQNWSDNGYFGVDLETATTLSVAQSFGTKSGAILYLDDHIIAGRHVLEVSEEEERLKEKGREGVFRTALEAVVHCTV